MQPANAPLMSHLFILGRQPELSLAELGAFFDNGVRWDGRSELAETGNPLPLPAPAFLRELGGTIGIMEVRVENVPEIALASEIKNLLQKEYDGKGKLPFAIDTMVRGQGVSLMRRLLTGVKKALRAEGVPAKFLNNNFSAVSRVLSFKEGLPQTGRHLVIVPDEINKGRFRIAAVRALQDVDEYSKRDYGKVFRDSRAGMLPPKLAQMMINLAVGAKADDYLVYDPFCGSGTILMEAMLRGCSVAGSDLEAETVRHTEENIDWFRGNFKIDPAQGAVLFAKSAENVLPGDLAPLFDSSTKLAIVAEPFLGPPMRDEPDDRTLQHVIEKLSNLYLSFFENLAKWIPSGTPIVFLFPFWKRHHHQFVHLSEKLVDKIVGLGYSKSALAPLERTALPYQRPDQIVGRDIVRLIKH